MPWFKWKPCSLYQPHQQHPGPAHHPSAHDSCRSWEKNHDLAAWQGWFHGQSLETFPPAFPKIVSERPFGWIKVTSCSIPIRRCRAQDHGEGDSVLYPKSQSHIWDFPIFIQVRCCQALWIQNSMSNGALLWLLLNHLDVVVNLQLLHKSGTSSTTWRFQLLIQCLADSFDAVWKVPVLVGQPLMIQNLKDVHPSKPTWNFRNDRPWKRRPFEKSWKKPGIFYVRFHGVVSW